MNITTRFDETLAITECKDGFWLYDKTRGMNLSMRAKSKDDAFFEALKYYQRRLLEVEGSLRDLSLRINNFVDSFKADSDE